MDKILVAEDNEAFFARMQKCSQYIDALIGFDWQFEHSDDQTVWRRGKEGLAALRTMQQTLDPTGEFWNAYAPAPYKMEKPQ